MQAYQPDLFIVANLELHHSAMVEDCVVEWLPVTAVVQRVRETLHLA